MPFDPSDPSPIPSLSDYSWPTTNQLAAIGSVIATWSYLELAFETLICTLAQSDQMLGQALTEDLAPDTRLKAASRLITTWETVVIDLNAQQRKALSDARDHVRWIKQKKSLRNVVAHRLWARQDDEQLFGWKNSIKPADALPPSSENVSKTSLREFCLEIGQAAERIRLTEVELRELPEWPRARRDESGIMGMESLLMPYMIRAPKTE